MNLIKAAGQSERRVLADAIKESTNLEIRNEQGRTALMIAVASKVATASMVELLLKEGADPNALTVVSQPEPFSAETLELFKEQGIELPSGDIREVPKSVLAIAVNESKIDKIELLLAAGADATLVDDHGYSILLLACYGAFNRTAENNRRLFTLLHEHGARETPATQYGETITSVLSNQGHFELLELVLELGADPFKLNWTPLFHAIAFGDVSKVKGVLSTETSLEHRDSWERTPFLLAVQKGALEPAKLLLNHGSDQKAVGRCGATALHYSVKDNSVAMCRWLVEQGSDLHATDDFGVDVLKSAIQNGAVGCAEVLIDAGADVFQVGEYGFDLMHDAETIEMFELLEKKGLSTAGIDSEMRKELLGGTGDGTLNVSKSTYQDHRTRKFGVSNPQEMNNPFWNAMIHARITAYQANAEFGQNSMDFSEPTWCFDRFGQSFTRLPDGRIVEIGGEHEDGYDPDFCIYNDVVVHAGKGNFSVFGYPKSVFPPTDFHSATYVNGVIVIIGRLGYHEERHEGSTPVCLLDCSDWSIQNLKTTGQVPGWIFKHSARLIDDNTIEISGGKTEANGTHEDNERVWTLDLVARRWNLLTQ